MQRMQASSPYDYVRDDEKRRISVLVRTALPPEDFVRIIDRQAQEQTWSYAMLYDLRAVSAPLSKQDYDTLAAEVFRHVAVHGDRGPVAVVTTSADAIGAIQLYAYVLERAGVNLQVFWDLSEADRWLDDPAAHQ
jgi:Mg-chelatase subunit ChlI